MNAITDALADVGDLVIQPTHQRGAHRARRLALRAEHVAVDDERVVMAEQVCQRHVGAVLGDEVVVARNLAARRKVPSQRGDVLGLPAKPDLFDEQLLPGRRYSSDSLG